MDTRTRLTKCLLLGFMLLLQSCYRTSDSESDNAGGTDEDDSAAQTIGDSVGDDGSESGSKSETETIDTETVDTETVDTETIDTETVDTDGPETCTSHPSCSGGEFPYIDEVTCQAEADDCRPSEECDTIIWCGNRLPSLDFLYDSEKGSISVRFQPSEGFYYLTCNRTVKLYTFEGESWVKINDLRYLNTPHYVDDVFVNYSGECGLVDCYDHSAEGASTVHHIQVGSAAPPEDSLIAESVDQIPSFETHETQPPWRVEVEYYTDKTCSGEPLIFTHILDPS